MGMKKRLSDRRKTPVPHEADVRPVTTTNRLDGVESAEKKEDRREDGREDRRKDGSGRESVNLGSLQRSDFCRLYNIE